MNSTYEWPFIYMYVSVSEFGLDVKLQAIKLYLLLYIYQQIVQSLM
jgi:hypothetical protein